MGVLATIIIPTHDHGKTLHFAVDSVLNQTMQDFEIFIIGDGVPPDAKLFVDEVIARDSRIRFFDYEKHQSRGEPYRHDALLQANGEIVCYLCDRDLWFSDHVSTLAQALMHADFAHTLALHMRPEVGPKFFPVDLSLDEYRKLLLGGTNRIPLSCAGHSLAFYQTLPFGWRTTPKGNPTDLYMFQQFLQQRQCIAMTVNTLTAITFPSPPRRGMTHDDRVRELESWWKRISRQTDASQLREELTDAAIRQRDAVLIRQDSKIDHLNAKVMQLEKERQRLSENIRQQQTSIEALKKVLEQLKAEQNTDTGSANSK